jgi:hypothetical protein
MARRFDQIVGWGLLLLLVVATLALQSPAVQARLPRPPPTPTCINNSQGHG